MILVKIHESKSVNFTGLLKFFRSFSNVDVKKSLYFAFLQFQINKKLMTSEIFEVTNC